MLTLNGLLENSSSRHAFQGPVSVADHELLATCEAVISSLTRSDMKDRAFLSWLTGYSAFSAALCLVYLASRRRHRSAPERTLPSQTVESGRRSLPEPFRQGNETYEELFRDAAQVMTIVGRQFTLIADYRTFVTKLRTELLSNEYTNEGLMEEIASTMTRSSPGHLRSFAFALTRR